MCRPQRTWSKKLQNSITSRERILRNKKGHDSSDQEHKTKEKLNALVRIWTSEGLWQSIGAQDPTVWGSILHDKDSKFFLCLTLVTMRTTFHFITLPSRKSTIFLFHLLANMLLLVEGSATLKKLKPRWMLTLSLLITRSNQLFSRLTTTHFLAN